MIEFLSVQATIISYPDIPQQPSYWFLFSFVLIVWYSLFLCIPASAHVMGTSSGLFSPSVKSMLVNFNAVTFPGKFSRGDPNILYIPHALDFNAPQSYY